MGGLDDSMNEVAGSDKPYNLARGRPTQQVSVSQFGSVAFRGESSRAVDGNKSGAYADKSCTHTFSQMNPWWRVDLAKTSTVFSVRIFGRTDDIDNCNSGGSGKGPCGLEKVQVYVSDKPYASSGTPCLEEPATLDTKGTSVNCNRKAGKYVFVQKEGLAALSLCEVEVVGLPGAASTAPGAKPAVKNANPLYAVKLKNGWETVKYGQPTYAHVEKNCPTCQAVLCTLNGEVKQAGDATPDPESLVGEVPFMCVPQFKQTFLQANAKTGNVWVTVSPDAKITASRFLNKEENEVPTVSLNGIYYMAGPTGPPPKNDKDAAGMVPEGYEGFKVQRVGDICMVWGQVGGESGTKLGSTGAGCRPTQKLVLHAAANEQKAWISINTAGEVTLEAMGPIGPKYPTGMAGSDDEDAPPVDWDAFIGGKKDIDINSLKNQTGRYPNWDGKDPGLETDMTTTAGVPVGDAEKPAAVELLQEDETVENKKISISLAGIVYSVEDHHIYTRKPRVRTLNAEEVKEIKAKKDAEAVQGPDACDLPKLKNEGYKTELKTALDRIKEDQASALKLRIRAGKAYTDDLREKFEEQRQEKLKNVAELSKDRKIIQTKELKHKAINSNCLKDKAPLTPTETAKDMCKKWNGRRGEREPDCCNQIGGCALAQVRDIRHQVQVAGLKLEEDRKKYDDEIKAASGKSYWSNEKKIVQNNQAASDDNKEAVKENAAKASLVADVQAAMAISQGGRR